MKVPLLGNFLSLRAFPLEAARADGFPLLAGGAPPPLRPPVALGIVVPLRSYASRFDVPRQISFPLAFACQT